MNVCSSFECVSNIICIELRWDGSHICPHGYFTVKKRFLQIFPAVLWNEMRFSLEWANMSVSHKLSNKPHLCSWHNFLWPLSFLGLEIKISQVSLSGDFLGTEVRANLCPSSMGLVLGPEVHVLPGPRYSWRWWGLCSCSFVDYPSFLAVFEKAVNILKKWWELSVFVPLLSLIKWFRNFFPQYLVERILDYAYKDRKISLNINYVS